jgi:hypothetical protein
LKSWKGGLRSWLHFIGSTPYALWGILVFDRHFLFGVLGLCFIGVSFGLIRRLDLLFAFVVGLVCIDLVFDGTLEITGLKCGDGGFCIECSMESSVVYEL